MAEIAGFRILQNMKYVKKNYPITEDQLLDTMIIIIYWLLFLLLFAPPCHDPSLIQHISLVSCVDAWRAAAWPPSSSYKLQRSDK